MLPRDEHPEIQGLRGIVKTERSSLSNLFAVLKSEEVSESADSSVNEETSGEVDESIDAAMIIEDMMEFSLIAATLADGESDLDTGEDVDFDLRSMTLRSRDETCKSRKKSRSGFVVRIEDQTPYFCTEGQISCIHRMATHAQ